MIARWFKNYQTEIFIFLLAFGIRFLYAILVQIFFGADGFLAHSDAFSFYLRAARNIVDQHIFSMNQVAPYMSDAYRPPLYTGLVALFLWLKSPLFGVIVLQNILAGVMSVLIYRIGLILFASRFIGLFAAIVMSVEPISIYWNNLLMSDYLFAFFFIFACHEFFLRRYYSFGILFGLATLTRSVGMYFFPLFLIFSFIEWFVYKRALEKFPWKKLAITALLFFLVLFPWLLRNKIVFNTWQLSSASWYNISILGQKFADRQGLDFLKPTLPLDYPNPEVFHYDFVNVPFYKQQFLSLIKEQPIAYAQYHGSLVLKSLFINQYKYLENYVLKPKLPVLFDGWRGNFISVLVALGGAAWVIAYVLMLVSFLVKKYRLWLVLFLVIIGLNALTLGALGQFGPGVSRFNIPLAPFILLFAGVGIQLLFNKVKALWK